MIYADSHTHSVFSFDGHQSVDELCRSAIEKGIQKIALTDHLDCDGEFEGYYDHYDAEGAKKAVLEAREKYEGKVEIAYGVELGQPYTHPKETRALIEKQGFDFIIGSLHNLVGVPDFCMLDYTKMTDRQIELLWQRDLDETYRLLLDEGTHGCKIDTLAHLTYPV
jgi:histidinol-phosphatase (PHP family)